MEPDTKKLLAMSGAHRRDELGNTLAN